MSQSRLKTLYMLWPPEHLTTSISIKVPEGFKLRSFEEKDAAKYLRFVSQEEQWLNSEKELEEFLKVVLPNSLLLVEEMSTNEIVAAAGAIHNPKGGSHYFPNGGELAFVLVKPAYRRKGLGRLVCLAAVNCFIKEGYTSIRLGVRPNNTGAIRLYLSLGFRPFIYSREMENRWEALLNGVGWPVEQQQWIYNLSGAKKSSENKNPVPDKAKPSDNSLDPQIARRVKASLRKHRAALKYLKEH